MITLHLNKEKLFHFRTQIVAVLAKFRSRDNDAFDSLISASYLRADFVAFK